MPSSPRRGVERDVVRVLNALPAMVGYWDSALRNVVANDAYVEFFGRTPAEMRGIHISTLLGAELYEKNLPFIERALAGERQLFDREIPAPDGSLRYTQASYIPDLVGGQVVGFFVLVTDITERRVAELQRELAERRFRGLFEAAPIGMFLLSGEGTIVDLNEAAAGLLGRPRVALLGHRTAEFVHPDDVEMSRDQLAALIDGHVPAYRIETRYVHPDGTDLWVQFDARMFEVAEGDDVQVLAQVQDITARKLAEARTRLHSIVTQVMAQGALVIRSSDGAIIDSNPALEGMFGYAPGELNGQHVSVLNAVTEHSAEQVATRVLDELARDGQWAGEILSVRKNGSTFWRETSIRRIEDPVHGELLVSVITDTTERRARAAEESARRAITELVAQGAEPEVIYQAIADGARDLLDAEFAAIVRFDEAMNCGVFLATSTPAGWEAGTVVPLDGSSASARVFRTGRAARFESDPSGRTDPALAQFIASGLSAGVAVPITVDGRLWGTISTGFRVGRTAPDAERRLARFAEVVSNAIANAQSLEKLRRQASTDSLTGLTNRRVFHERLTAEAGRAERYMHPLSLALIDIDHFKKINDTHGHEAGDRTLKFIADLLAEHARATDTVARVGGEEFAWLMPETILADAHSAVTRFQHALAEIELPEIAAVTISAGIATARTPAALRRNADRALYAAKNAGRNRVNLDPAPGGTASSLGPDHPRG